MRSAKNWLQFLWSAGYGDGKQGGAQHRQVDLTEKNALHPMNVVLPAEPFSEATDWLKRKEHLKRRECLVWSWRNT